MDNNNPSNFWEIDPVQKTVSYLYTNANLAYKGPLNALAYDKERDQLFFISASKQLWCIDQNNNLLTIINSLPSYFFSIYGDVPANAAYYNNAIWLFKEGTNELYKISLKYSNYPYLTPSVLSITLHRINGIPASSNFFGDIAINTDTGMAYGSNTDGKFYSLNLTTDPSNTFNLIKNAATSGSMQLSFDCNNNTLYGHYYGNGQWYSINTSNGNLTNLNFATPVRNETNNVGMRDLAGARKLSRLFPTTPNQPWDLTVQTTAANQSFSIILNGTNPNFQIDWGDGTIENFVYSGATFYNPINTRRHYYAASGTYNVKLSGSYGGGDGGVKFCDGYRATIPEAKRLKSIGVIPDMKLRNFGGMFNGCSSLTSLPSGLFQNYPRVNYYVFNGTFAGCTGLTSLPNDLFQYNTSVYNNEFLGTFDGCSNLTSIPEDLFRYSPVVGNNFTNVLGRCVGLSGTMPANIFRYNTSVKDFGMVTLPTLTSERYNAILNSLNTYYSGISGVRIGFDLSQATGSGLVSRSALIARGWTIYDYNNRVPAV
ncbi:MAG: hypothetical protein EBU90_03805 [Proteobacteria bacterium]|nr:hypothetical protein [Pseudomonadota bacterium]NBP14193.1 hypothetical protein [bacterium]